MLKGFNLNNRISKEYFIKRLNSSNNPLIEKMYFDEEIEAYRVIDSLVILKKRDFEKSFRGFLQISGSHEKSIYSAKRELENLIDIDFFGGVGNVR